MRYNNATPSSASNSPICLLTAAEEISNDLAAPVKLAHCTTLQKVWISPKVFIGLP
ncbi:protein of unknown function [Legionella fallonii LLAP-10]|uniref:Uncharacterized protein n=1 Tax=Legionella fallonii LLAP-10 TaxID=1212491 RepID=A0A098G0L7_9GAMM|nr:protein of unknown function [Legionella fallonii LLAP-10]